MGEEQEVNYSASPSYSTQADKSVQEFRLDLTPILLDIRTAMTGQIYRGGKWVKIREKALVCQQHWEDFSSNILIEINRGMILSKLFEEVVERITTDFGRRTLAWLCSNCLFCPSCGFNGNYGKVSMLCFSLTDKMYYNLNRAVGGHESQMLSTMQTIATHESYNKNTNEGQGFFRSRRKGN